jgi:hypothetical protein
MRETATALMAAMVLSCGGTPSAPTPTSTPPPQVIRANLTGAWEVSLVGVAATAIVPGIALSLKETNGTVEGVLQFSGDTEAPGLKGAVSATGGLTLSGAYVSFSVSVDDAGRSFSGSYVVKEDDGTGVTFSVRGAKRSDTPTTLIPNDARVPGRSRVDEAPWTLSQPSRLQVNTGSILAAASKTDVTLDFGGSYIILACFGTTTACIPFGGRPATASFTVPSGPLVPGPLLASVYFNPNFAQPAGDATGVVRFNYNPQWR